MKILVVGGTGHIGSYLVPRFILNGHEVSVVSRNSQPKYAKSQITWNKVKWIIADKTSEEKEGTWSNRMADIEVDVVIDLLCFSLDQNRMMYEAFRGRIDHFIHCGTI